MTIMTTSIHFPLSGINARVMGIAMIFALLFALPVKADNVMTKQADGTYVVNTTTICKARGYRKTTPVEVYINKGKVVKVVALKNEETVPYFTRVKESLLPLYNNLKLAKAKKLTEKTKVDGCTGATFSTKAVQKNISAALEYYEKHK